MIRRLGMIRRLRRGRRGRRRREKSNSVQACVHVVRHLQDLGCGQGLIEPRQVREIHLRRHRVRLVRHAHEQTALHACRDARHRHTTARHVHSVAVHRHRIVSKHHGHRYPREKVSIPERLHRNHVHIARIIDDHNLQRRLRRRGAPRAHCRAVRDSHKFKQRCARRAVEHVELRHQRRLPARRPHAEVQVRSLAQGQTCLVVERGGWARDKGVPTGVTVMVQHIGARRSSERRHEQPQVLREWRRILKWTGVEKGRWWWPGRRCRKRWRHGKWRRWWPRRKWRQGWHRRWGGWDGPKNLQLIQVDDAAASLSDTYISSNPMTSESVHGPCIRSTWNIPREAHGGRIRHIADADLDVTQTFLATIFAVPQTDIVHETCLPEVHLNPWIRLVVCVAIPLLEVIPVNAILCRIT
mmetsp:Transcript_24511/g.80013  ORF Transcript_24511/g.80013 Transcript_24511/m.80013 type:complete len:412 (+) Transcript_24511:723-1958(+)